MTRLTVIPLIAPTWKVQREGFVRTSSLWIVMKCSSSYRKRRAAQHPTSNGANTQLPNEPAPTPPIKTASAEDEMLVRHAKSRDAYHQSIGYPLDAEGAVRPVRAGDSPTGVPATLCEYKPR